MVKQSAVAGVHCTCNFGGKCLLSGAIDAFNAIEIAIAIAMVIVIAKMAFNFAGASLEWQKESASMCLVCKQRPLTSKAMLCFYEFVAVDWAKLQIYEEKKSWGTFWVAAQLITEQTNLYIHLTLLESHIIDHSTLRASSLAHNNNNNNDNDDDEI